jgi:hypothetical protein
MAGKQLTPVETGWELWDVKNKRKGFVLRFNEAFPFVLYPAGIRFTLLSCSGRYEAHNLKLL